MSLKYLALGDSYTIGESVQLSERFPNRLAAALEEEGLPADLTIIARTGWTTDDLWEGIQKETLAPPYGMVSLLIGVNDQYRGYDINEYRAGFALLLGKAIECAGEDAERVIVFSIPDWGVTPFAAGRDAARIAREIDAFNKANLEETKKSGAHYVDVTPVSRLAKNDPAWIAGDGLHPSGKMYAEWAKSALPIALEILKK